jgi:hypothetical protein
MQAGELPQLEAGLMPSTSEKKCPYSKDSQPTFQLAAFDMQLHSSGIPT